MMGGGKGGRVGGKRGRLRKVWVTYAFLGTWDIMWELSQVCVSM